MSLTNWGGNLTFATDTLHRPRSVAEVQQIVAAAQRIRVLGTGHSFSAIADTTGELLSVAGLPQVIEVDSAAARVRVSAGTRYGDLAPVLEAHGLALANLGSLPHISIAGACSTGTHGSGDGNRVLASAVSAMEYVGADGELITHRRGEPDFDGSVIGLGSLGVITALTLDLQPTYELCQYVYEGLPYRTLLDDPDSVLGAAYSVSLFTDWTGDRVGQVWLKAHRPEPAWLAGEDWLGATPADGPRHPIPQEPGEVCTEQAGVVGPWYERLPHFRMEFTPSKGDEIQSEYFIAREHASAAFGALRQISAQLAPVLMISEVRTIAADQLWTSCAYDRDSVALHFTWIQDMAAIAPAVAAVEHVLEPFEPRPHWGKVFGIPPQVVSGRHPRMADFARLVRERDPAGRFANDFVGRYLR